MADLQAVSVQLHPITCHKCAGVYGIAERFQREASQVGPDKDWVCPYCKVLTAYVKGENALLKQRLEWKQGEIARANSATSRAWDAKHRVELQLRATKGVVTRTKRRIANGVCPCCNRTFANLARHMTGRHPGYVAQEVGHG